MSHRKPSSKYSQPDTSQNNPLSSTSQSDNPPSSTFSQLNRSRYNTTNCVTDHNNFIDTPCLVKRNNTPSVSSQTSNQTSSQIFSEISSQSSSQTLSQSSSRTPSQQNMMTSDIIIKYPNINTEIKNLMKGQILNKYVIDYDKTLSEQSEKIYKKLISELKKLMSGHFNLSVTQLAKMIDKRNRRIKAAIKLYEQNDYDIQEFDKDELLPILAQNGYYSIEQSDLDDESCKNCQATNDFSIYMIIHSLKHLLRDMLDPSAEQIQHAKKQQE
ncbi:4689_t:CDS:2 [Funneliformis caledonium]|uniref:4689_t:CDS:1 n=1 Tax=Funneliformis caledonium TaxID=1117310 RepID=A0A9N9C3B2_9GLOM|nr:4689_t:CDS:2 [Funneliformis caledonium]